MLQSSSDPLQSSAISLFQIAPSLIISVSALVVAFAAGRLLLRRDDLPSSYRRLGVVLLVGLLVLTVAEAASAIALWQAAYQFWWIADVAAAAVALVAVFVTLFVLPELLLLPSPRQLQLSNQQLKSEIGAHLSTMTELHRVRDELEEQVAIRTAELTAINQRFRAALAGSDIAVFTQDRNLVFTWSYDPQSGRRPEDFVGATDQVMFPEPTAGAVIEAKRGVIASGQGISINVALPTENGVSRYLRLSMEPLRDERGEIVGLTSAVVDLTERHDYETRLSALTTSLAEANARFDLALRGSTIMVFSQDAELRYNWVYNPALGLTAEELLGRRDTEIWDEAAINPLIALKQTAISTGEAQEGDIALTLDHQERFFKVRLETMFNGVHDVTGIAGIAVDVTQARQQEAHLRLVMRELTHRSKNLLAVIQAMARQTAARSDDPSTFVARFSARLRAMAASHDLLVAQEWHGVVLHDLVKAQVAQAIDPGSDQVTIDGPMISLKPDAVQNIGLALHELTTNASKYGALSVPDGKISMSWQFVDGGRLHLQWREVDGPPVGQPNRTGFGVTLLERTVGQALDGVVSLDFNETGFICDIDIPASYVLA